MNPGPRSGAAGRAVAAASVAKDPLVEVTRRKLEAEARLNAAGQAVATAKAALSNAATAETRLAAQKKEIDALHEQARRTHAEAVRKAEAVEVLRSWADTDLTIAKLEHELRAAEVRAAAPGADDATVAAAAAAKTRLAREKELRDYDGQKEKATKAQDVIDKIASDTQRAARAAALNKIQSDLEAQLKRKEHDKAKLAATVKKASEDAETLTTRLKEIQKERAALAGGK